MSLTLYDLKSLDGRQLSPFGQRVHLALRHKALGLDKVELVRFVDKEAIAFAKSQTVPVLVDGDRVVADSWRIANHLEDAYTERPSLFGGEAGRALARYFNNWCGLWLTPEIASFILFDMLQHIDEEDRAYIRRTREPRFGPLEALNETREARLPAFRKALDPLRLTVKQNGNLHGARPGMADFMVAASFHWAAQSSAFALLNPDDPLYSWSKRINGPRT
ncbi:MAG: glutathione S-transferase N-terminal domain-containing protein [Reyranella sp.]|nr:glutathione S-transferase N-terminal domain-containing protein [Reyranella sp.]